MAHEFKYSMNKSFGDYQKHVESLTFFQRPLLLMLSLEFNPVYCTKTPTIPPWRGRVNPAPFQIAAPESHYFSLRGTAFSHTSLNLKSSATGMIAVNCPHRSHSHTLSLSRHDPLPVDPYLFITTSRERGN